MLVAHELFLSALSINFHQQQDFLKGSMLVCSPFFPENSKGKTSFEADPSAFRPKIGLRVDVGRRQTNRNYPRLGKIG